MGNKKKMTVLDFQKYKDEGRKFSFVTAYDYTTASIVNESDCEIILVGDSLGMIMLGYNTTVPVTVDDMIHHIRPVVKGAPDTFIIGDMPFGSYNVSKEQAIETKMEYARKHGNQEQLRGLEEALSQVRRWCSDGTLRSKAELNILEKQDKVKERQADLDKAVTEGKGEKKIAKLQRKLGEAKEELAQAVAKRDALAQ